MLIMVIVAIYLAGLRFKSCPFAQTTSSTTTTTLATAETTDLTSDFGIAYLGQMKGLINISRDY